MPKRKRRKSTIPKEPYKAAWEPRNPLSEDAGRDLLGFAFIFAGLLVTLSYFNFSGSVGQTIFGILNKLFGITALAAGPILLLIAAGLIKKKIELGLRTLGGIVLFALSLSGLGALLNYGGTAGGLITTALSPIGPILTVVLLTLTLVAGMIIALNKNLSSILNKKEQKKSGEPVMVNLPKSKALFPNLFQPKPQSLEPAVKIARPNPRSNWTPYPLDLLAEETDKPATGDIAKQSEAIKHTLATFGVEVTMGDVNVGPTVTQFTLKPEEGIKLTQITGLANDLALALAAQSVRVEAPIPGKGLVGIEIPNKTPAVVRLRSLLESKEYQKINSELAFPLGRSVAGDPIAVDIKAMPHLLIAGATKSGKSVAINSLLLSLLYRNSPDELRLILVDPKRVELTPYNDIPHLLTQVITEPEKAISALRWSIDEMDKRFVAFSEIGVRNIDEFHGKNRKVMPHLVIVIDEMATLMQLASKEVEVLITRLAQMARATGIHLVLATQRPDVNVVTGLIKANVTSRIAFAVTSQIDSRTILDFAGAEKLLGKGDMLYTSAELPKPIRAQSAYVSTKETENVIAFLKSLGAPEYDEAVISHHVTLPGRGNTVTMSNDFEDDLFDQAVELVVRAGKASASLLQRHLRIGYARAARLLDLLEEKGVVGPGDGAKPREVLVSGEENIAEGVGADHGEEV